MMDKPISERAQHLLKMLIKNYIKDGQPVASRTLKEQGLDLSPATIRSVLADLEDHGYLVSLHTSSGRVPTTQGYRFYVNHLLSTSSLEQLQVDTLREQLNVSDSWEELAGTASRLISNLTQLVSVVTLPKYNDVKLRRLEFLPLSGDRVLVILVVNNKEVQNRIIHTQKIYSEAELKQAANFLNQHYAGHDLLAMRQSLLNSLAEEQSRMNQLLQTAVDVAAKALPAEETTKDYVLAGELNLWGMAENGDLERLKKLFETFSRKHKILSLLDTCIAADSLQIFIGEESNYKVFDNCSVVTAPYSVDGKILGALGVIGPRRMVYEKVIPIVDITAKLLSMSIRAN